ncbi:hypothetical protein L2Y94_05665 [Luteibacter aegosomatis]|uniref:hypothetical protein n=1 Tax=Luteibacter aegosomatis TaxID=2911537 RepID=UPI001FF9351C|nr:hypothetical protein [Luteibacter aegosomatis]UPG86841.1 hypothetical protein L2Y94_05665 [Luteibacter aegosomatis]
MNKLYAYTTAALLLVIAIGATAWRIDYLSNELTEARNALTTKQTDLDTCAGALVQANDATAQAEAKADLMRSQAQTLIDGAASRKGKNTAAGAVFAQKVTASAKAPDCHSVLEAALCPALSGY